jgi:hypothetical protein
MKRIILGACALAAALFFVANVEVYAEGFGVPNATLEAGQLSIDIEGTYVQREVEQDKGIFRPLVGDSVHRDNEQMRSQRMYVKLSYGIYNDPTDGFLKGAEGFVRLGTADLDIQDVLLDDNSGGGSAGVFNHSFTGAFELAVGGGVKGTLFRQGPLNVGLTIQTLYFETEDKYTYTGFFGGPMIQHADISVLETDATLAASYEFDLVELGYVTPYAGVVGNLTRGDVDYRSELFVPLGPGLWINRAHSYKFDQESPLGALVGVDWRLLDYVHMGIEGTFYGDGNSATVFGGVRF